MTNPTRLMIAHNEATERIAAIDLDSQTQVLITDPAEHYNFFVDCIGLDQTIADRYDAGQVIACGMTPDNWSAWCEHYYHAAENSPHVWLTVSPEGNMSHRILSAMELISKREIIALDETPAFIADVQGWNESAYQKNFSFVCRMSAETWAQWLAVWETIDATDPEIAAAITA